MYKVALVGLGGISNTHLPVWKELDDCELVAVCDTRPEQMDAYPDARHYTDFYEMLEKEKLDILDICVPTFLHTKFALAAMKKGIHVLCEKPVSMEVGDVELLYRTAEENHVKFMVAQCIRFWPEYVLLKEIYDTGRYGKLLSGEMERLGCYPKWSWDGWMMDEPRSGFVPFDLHIHDLDFVVYAFGAPVKVDHFRSKQKDQDFLHAVYSYPDFFVSVEASWFAAPYQKDIAYTLTATDHHAVFSRQRVDVFTENEVVSTESARQHKDATDLVAHPYRDAVGTLVRSDHMGISNQYVGDDKCIVESHNLIRRLTPLECERLQGFPDGWTNIPGASDSARYKALGNSVAIPCVEYVMRGITLVLRSGAGCREEKG